jgi:hypothetical protein
MKTLPAETALFLFPVFSFALGIVWLVCAVNGASQWLYPAALTMMFMGGTGCQAAAAIRLQAKRISALEARLAGRSQVSEPLA